MLPRLFLFFFLAFFPLQASFGQVLVGPTFGGNLIGETPDVRLGIPIIVPLMDFLEVQAEVAWTNRYNASFVRRLDIEPEGYSSSVSYAEFGAMIRPRLRTEQITVYALAGPSISYGQEIHLRYLEKSMFMYQEIPLKELDLQEWDIGLQVGMGISKTLLNEVRLQVEYRLYYGVTDLDRQESQSVYNQSQYLTMGFLFPLGGVVGY